MDYLNKSIEINHVEIKNRLVMPPMATSASKDGSVTEKLLKYYDEKSAGGFIGLIITEHSYINPQGMANPGQVSIGKDSDIEGLRELAQTIHNNGTKVIAQISHAGSSASQKVTGMPIVSASAIVNPAVTARNGELPEAMDLDQIEAVVNDFALAAKRAKEAGFDGVEIHSAHGYLLNQFYSPLTNKRTDAYTGATIEGRLKIHQEIIQAIRKMVGEDYLVAVRLGGCDYMDGGSTVEDSIEAAVLLEKWGINLLDISGGLNGYIVPGYKEPGYFSEMTAKIKEKVSIPVILTGGVTEAADAEQLLKDGKADLIGVGRAIFKDSKWAEKNMK
ncbi:MAG: NADH:flavin oxidoreductase [bacterium]|nr:NADH:flavin oxidoreductase [bacterium]